MPIIYNVLRIDFCDAPSICTKVEDRDVSQKADVYEVNFALAGSTPELELSCLSWKWRKRSSVKITERTHEKATEALHAGRESGHSEEAFGGSGTDLGSV